MKITENKNLSQTRQLSKKEIKISSWIYQWCDAVCIIRRCYCLNQDVIGENAFIPDFPFVGPMGSRLDHICTCITRPLGQQHETINVSLWYSVTGEIEEQDIFKDGRKGIDWSLTSRAIIFFTFFIQFNSFTLKKQNEVDISVLLIIGSICI